MCRKEVCSLQVKLWKIATFLHFLSKGLSQTFKEILKAKPGFNCKAYG